MSPYLWLNFIYLQYVRIVGRTELYQESYNPKNLWLYKKGAYKQAGEPRGKIVLKGFDYSSIFTVLDIGCQFGYYTSLIADKKHVTAIGLDRDVAAIRYASSLSVINGLENVLYGVFDLNVKTAKKLPSVDMTLFFNVIHHLIHACGKEEALGIFERIALGCDHLAFEAPSIYEIDYSWSKEYLDVVGDSETKFFSTFLKTYGFTLVSEHEVPSHLSEKSRSLMLFSKKIE